MDCQQLFIKYLKGTINKDELLLLLEYLENKPTKELEQITEELWYSNGHKHMPNPQTLLNEINRKIKVSQAKTVYFTPMRIAAAILLTILASAILFFVTDLPVTENTVAINEIVKLNPPGQKSKIFLPDGSSVVLNSGSTISYPEYFTDTLRRVVLEGEAFFEVRNNGSKPFQVYSRGVVTTALGTSFNIKAYPGDSDVMVALATGKVLVHKEDPVMGEEIYLEPGSAAVYNQSKGHFTMIDYDYNLVIGWKDGIIVFENASKKEVFNTLSRWYGVEIVEENISADAHWNYSSQFRNEYLENILESIGFSKNFDYRINDKEVIIKYQ
jgi:transmembrane sensor